MRVKRAAASSHPARRRHRLADVDDRQLALSPCLGRCRNLSDEELHPRQRWHAGGKNPTVADGPPLPEVLRN